ncbi:hypothetical protein [Shimia isoporae]|nr:hypothetical protein [Shimia isoporae]
MFAKKIDFKVGIMTRVVAGLTLAASSVHAQEGQVIVEQMPSRIGGFETANTHHKGTLGLTIGWHQSDPRKSAGTGNQLYYGGGSFAVTDQLTFGFDAQTYDDPTIDPIGGTNPAIKMNTLAAWGKYNFYRDDRVSVSGLLSVENMLHARSPIWGGSSRHEFIGALKLPVSYQVSDSFALHFTPSVTVMPDSLNGAQFFGTIGSLGVGATIKAGRRLSFAAAVDTPVSGTNTISSSGGYKKAPVWTVSGQYNVTPKAALQAYLTNGVGMTPATSILTHWPEGDEILAGLQLVYTPGAARPESYRGAPAPVTARQVSLQQDGVILGSADVAEPGHLRASLWGGSDSAGGVALGFSPDRDGEIQVIFEQYSKNSSAPSSLVPTNSVRYMFGPKLRFMDQNNGDPFSLGARLLYGRQIDSRSGVGVFYFDAMASYKTGRVALTANPKLAAFGNVEAAGVGLGVNFAVSDAIELIAEVTPVLLDASDVTWAAGMRYNVGSSGLSVDLNATNAIGQYGIGTLVAQDDVRFSLMLSKSFDLRGLKFY